MNFMLWITQIRKFTPYYISDSVMGNIMKSEKMTIL